MKSRRKPSLVQSRRQSGARRALAFFTLFAFLLQGIITQTHIHGATFSSGSGVGAWLAEAASADEAALAAKAPTKKLPAGDDSSRCPICQTAQLAGAFVAAAAVVVLLPSQSVSLIPVRADERRDFETASHSWRGRAPPRH
jgi:hypothetical protein